MTLHFWRHFLSLSLALVLSPIQTQSYISLSLSLPLLLYFPLFNTHILSFPNTQISYVSLGMVAKEEITLWSTNIIIGKNLN